MCDAVRPMIIDIIDPYFDGDGKRLGQWEYEEFLSMGDETFTLSGPLDECGAIALNYTSGTTGEMTEPQAVVLHVIFPSILLISTIPLFILRQS